MSDENNAEKIGKEMKEETPPDKFIGNFAVIVGIIATIGHIIADIRGCGIFTELHLNFFIKILAFLLLFIVLTVAGWFIGQWLFWASTEAYEKNLPEKETIFAINKWTFWTGIIPAILYCFVFFKSKRNKFLDEDK